jgi:hypothetical protein
MIKGKALTLVTLATVGLIFIVASPQVQAGGWEKWYRLEGSWIRTIPGTTIASTVTYSPMDLLGRKALLRLEGLSVDMNLHVIPGLDCDDSGGLCLCPKTYRLTDFVGEAVKTGPSTQRGTAVSYGIRLPEDGEIRDQVECIWVGTGESEFTGPNSITGVDYISVYRVEQDKDGDLLPDPDETPMLCVPLPGQDTRVRIMPPCTPTPLP